MKKRTTFYSSRLITVGPRFVHTAHAQKGALMNNKGMALVLTLLVVAMLTALVAEFAYGVYVGTSALHNWETSQKLSVAARSAVRLGSKLISDNASQYVYTYPGVLELSQKIPLENIDGTIYLRIEDENAKFNLNTLGGLSFGSGWGANSYQSFVRLLKALDLNTDIADRVSYWIDSGTEHRPHGSEIATKGARLDSIDELLLIPGIDSESYEKLRPYVTIFTDNRININSAEIPVLMSLSDSMTREMAATIVEYRERTPFVSIAEINRLPGFGSAGMALLNSISVNGTSFRVVATAESGGIKRIIDVVLAGNGKFVKYWKEI